MTAETLRNLEETVPQLKALEEERELFWRNPLLKPAAQGHSLAPLTMADIDDAEARLARFAPFLVDRFPELAPANGVIESALRPVPALKDRINTRYGAGLTGTLLLKEDSHLAVAGSVIFHSSDFTEIGCQLRAMFVPWRVSFSDPYALYVVKSNPLLLVACVLCSLPLRKAAVAWSPSSSRVFLVGRCPLLLLRSPSSP